MMRVSAYTVIRQNLACCFFAPGALFSRIGLEKNGSDPSNSASQQAICDRRNLDCEVTHVPSYPFDYP